ncbi:MAG TPA: CHAD domain-containing protein [Anaerolineae bacterium]|nr:CHAD domain-containing protein [Anaerolineae bacterium]HQK14763.1 CHAD domain-containing protein [Anaerolineae bacterium]
MEVEAKFTIQDPQVYAQVQALDALGRFALAAGPVYDIHDIYFDTPDLRVLQAGYACRQREQNGQRLLTLKTLHGVSGAVHRREEWETSLPATAPIPPLPAQWPDDAPCRQLLTLTENAPLKPLFSLRQRRHTRPIHCGQRLVAEMNLDTVTLACAGSEQSFMELEIELKGEGNEADLAAILAYLAETPGLSAQPLSKFEQGLALLNAASPGLTPEDTVAEAARKTLRLHLLRMILNESGTRAGRDPEALHDMRVATRRMRTAFRVFADALDAEAMAPYLRDLRRTGRLLGRVRDLDVFREKAQAYLETFAKGAQPDLTALQHAWDAEYEHARVKLLKYLNGRRYARFKYGFALLIEAPFPTTVVALPYAAQRMAEAVSEIIRGRLTEFYACRARLEQPDATLTDYHQMRIVTKNLRYTLEYFREVLGVEAEQAITELKTLQNHLGALQDAVVASTHLHHVLAWGTWTPPTDADLRWCKAPVAAPDVAAYLAFQQAEIHRLVSAFPEAWKRLERAGFEPLIANAIAALST